METMKDEIKTCHDCGAKEGQIHEYGCDMEDCPFCGGQLLSCDCSYTNLGFVIDDNLPFSGLPENIYNEGLTDELWDKWVIILEKKGRIPYIVYPNLCVRCGKLWPDMFRLSDEEWKRYVAPRHRDEMLCLECYNHIKHLIDEGVKT